MFEQKKPEKITSTEWSALFKELDEATIHKFSYYHNSDWGRYLQPPATFLVYGAREIKRLKFDNSFAALRMWAFVFNESERLFRARQSGKKIIATMGDLGTVPVIIMAFPDCIPFYPECIWWTPFFNESTVLLDTSAKLGAPEAACFSRAALAAFYKLAYFPKPDALFASTGATCDDFSATMQQIGHLGYEIHWLEVPYRMPWYTDDPVAHEKTGLDDEYTNRCERILVQEYKKVWRHMESQTGCDDLNMLTQSIRRANRLRKSFAALKKQTADAVVAPFPALELMILEFGNLYGYADFNEWIDIVEMVRSEITQRASRQEGVLDREAIPIAWVTPSADPYLLNYVEDVGLRVVRTEYVINQALVEIDENIDPFLALARSFLKASLIGSTRQRIKTITEAASTGRIQGVLITNVLGGSHCAMETRVIEKVLQDIPVLSIDVPAPFGITEQIKTRIKAFAEALAERG